MEIEAKEYLEHPRAWRRMNEGFFRVSETFAVPISAGEAVGRVVGD